MLRLKLSLNYYLTFVIDTKCDVSHKYSHELAFFGRRNSSRNFSTERKQNDTNTHIQKDSNTFGRLREPHKKFESLHRNAQYHLRRFLPEHAIHGARHQLTHRVKEKVSMKIAEKFVQIIPGLLKRMGNALIGRVLWRKVARGLAVAIPAIGGVFAFFITLVDLKRAMKELKENRNRTAFLLFRWAAVFDIIDVVVHAFIAAGLAGFFVMFTPDIDLIHHSIHVAGAYFHCHVFERRQ